MKMIFSSVFTPFVAFYFFCRASKLVLVSAGPWNTCSFTMSAVFMFVSYTGPSRLVARVIREELWWRVGQAHVHYFSSGGWDRGLAISHSFRIVVSVNIYMGLLVCICMLVPWRHGKNWWVECVSLLLVFLQQCLHYGFLACVWESSLSS